jgi:hypothetical protein
MKLLVNCDQVFDVLTRGPFPTGEATDEAVEQHLRACHECRQLAEALRPAVELMHEAVASDQASGLPEYQGSLPEAERLDREPFREAWTEKPPVIDRSLALGVRQLTRRPKATRPEAGYVRVANATRLLAASVLAIAVGTLVVGLMISPEPEVAVVSLPEAAPPAASPLPNASEDPLVTLAALRLPATCFPLDYRKLTAPQAEALLTAMANRQNHTLHCCTECHHAWQPQPEASKLVAVAGNSCVACHRS